MASDQSTIDADTARSASRDLSGLGRLAAWCYDHRAGYYEVFLLSRMREEWARTGDNSAAVAGGLAATARVITSAAAIMVCVFGSFVIGDPLRILAVFGLGLAVAVLVDATVVRMVLVPAVMQLLGPANWWLPSWPGRATPRLVRESTADHAADSALASARRR
jgi:uncharacterized membrane protein YdfJ with MMPL/SSD domain